MPALSPGRMLGNIPAETTSFVGRRREISLARRLLRRARLLTVTGAPGIGKTRLALWVAVLVGSVFPDGVWLVELASLPDDSLLDQAFMDVLNIQDQPGQSSHDTLADHLVDKKLLLVVDNCHHLLDACGALMCRLLTRAPWLRILATSRQGLNVTGEQLLEVPPLSVPDPDSPLTTRAVSRSEAVRLLADRASLARPGFAVDAGNRVAVARLCERLGGLPLAIELAALRLRALSAAQVVERLDDYIQFLSGGSRIAVPRLETLGATIASSHDLCPNELKTLWARAAVFRGDFDLTAVEEVCAGANIACDDIVTLVAGLLERSILIRGDQDDVVRYRMLEPLRQYGLNKLRQAGEDTAASRRHRDHYLCLAEQGAAAWFGPHQSEWFTRIRREHANLRSALNFSLTAPGEHQCGLRMASALWFYWTACGFLKEGRHWLDKALALNPQPTRMRAKALWLDGRITVMQGDMTAALSRLDECRALARQLGDEHALAYATQMTGVARLLGGDLPRAAELLDEAVARHQANRELNSTALLAHLQLALTRALLGDLDHAVAVCEDCRAISDAHGESWALSFALHVLAFVGWRRGQWTAAAAYARDCLRLKRTFHDTLGMAESLELLAWIASSTGEHTRAAGLFGVAQRYWRTFGLPLFGSTYFLTHHDACERQSRHALGDKQFTSAYRHGSRLTREQGVTFALAGEGSRCDGSRGTAGSSTRSPPAPSSSAG